MHSQDNSSNMRDINISDIKGQFLPSDDDDSREGSPHDRYFVPVGEGIDVKEEWVHGNKKYYL